jgi:protein-S-isoprenylcysteine O-methyltransferase Ste14
MGWGSGSLGMTRRCSRSDCPPPIRSAQKGWDKIFLAAAMVLFVALDAGRWRWSSMPLWVALLGPLLVLLTWPISYLTFRENSYAAPVVKVQKERGQKTVSTGPYRHVRHPLYSGAALYLLGTPLLLGSWAGLGAGAAAHCRESRGAR